MEFLERFTDTLSDTKEMIFDALSNIREHLCDFFNEETTVTRKTITAVCVICALTGIIYGFLISPVKRGIQVNVNNNINDCEEDN